MLVNAKIEEIGLYFNGHYNHYCVRIVLEMRGGGGSVEFPVERIEEFMSMFDNELDTENGVFVQELKGTPVVLKTDGDRYGNIVAIGDIMADENELMQLKLED